MQGAGGLGAIDSCLLGNAEINGPTAPMFYGEPQNWGNYAGGITSEGGPPIHQPITLSVDVKF